MNVCVDANGWLSVWRVNKWVEQYCPWTATEGRCGQWCPLFQPEWEEFPFRKRLKLCYTVLIVDQVVDERMKGGERK
jgi:hypothetical protein